MIKIATEEKQNERLALCKACEHYYEKMSMCKKCGCFMPLKVKKESVKCPIDKW
jgi:hypothetical protein